MKLIVKIILISFFFIGLKSFAGTNNYVSIFRPVQKTKTISEFQRNIQKDFSQARRGLFGIEVKKETIEIVDNKEEVKISPLEI